MRSWSSLLLLFVFVAASCAAAGYYPAAEMTEMAAAGFAGGGDRGDVVSLDDETNGLVGAADDTAMAFDAAQWARAAAVDPAADPRAGVFFPPGEVGGAGADSVFLDSDGDGLPDRSAPSAAKPRRERMLVYRGSLAVEVPRAEDAAAAFLAQVEAWGGYLQSQNGSTLVVRLPATRFDEAFVAAKGAGRVLHEQRSASDVTEEFVDLGIRLDNARQSRQRLIELLAKADKVEDMLKIETELRRLTEEIERMEGRAKFLADQVAMATLELEFRSVAEAPPPTRRRQPSRFSWINQIGAASVMEHF